MILVREMLVVWEPTTPTTTKVPMATPQPISHDINHTRHFPLQCAGATDWGSGRGEGKRGERSGRGSLRLSHCNPMSYRASLVMVSLPVLASTLGGSCGH